MTPAVSTLDVLESVRALGGELVLRDGRLILRIPAASDADLLAVRALVSEHRGALRRILAGDVRAEDDRPWTWVSCPFCGAERRHGHPTRCRCDTTQDRPRGRMVRL